MNKCSILGWFYWDPPKEAFTIPYLDHPIVWYGILFVIGFILAYFVMNPILVRFLIQSRRVSTLDVTNWKSVLITLKSSQSTLVHEIVRGLNSSTQKQVRENSIENPLSLQLKEEILTSINHLLQNETFSRSEVNHLFGKAIASPKETSYFLTDRLSWFVIIGTIIGARLGAVFFYDWAYFRENPGEIFKVWHGGLASHGGTIGVVIALYFFLGYIHRWIPQLNFLQLLDMAAIPSAIVACFIRLGNFMNQEILGTPTFLPWGIIFGHPADGSDPIPRHPAQLYEAVAYLATFFILWKIWERQKEVNSPGIIVGLLFILIFTSRFIIEFWKESQESIFNNFYFQTGQLLSIPFILLGGYFVWRSNNSLRFKTPF